MKVLTLCLLIGFCAPAFAGTKYECLATTKILAFGVDDVVPTPVQTLKSKLTAIETSPLGSGPAIEMPLYDEAGKEAGSLEVYLEEDQNDGESVLPKGAAMVTLLAVTQADDFFQDYGLVSDSFLSAMLSQEITQEDLPDGFEFTEDFSVELVTTVECLNK
ncbi:MAG: hypothetical protein KDD38_03875 [Bdellovibrionales bacterium]|nr:hypothetical protein [Bdellovibrionales bacterium]